MKVYTGIGSRETPEEICKKMTSLACLLGKYDWTLRSGGASGADSAFEVGATKKEIFLPWKGFNNNQSTLYNISTEAYEIAKKYHPAWHKLSNGARKLHARNVYQVLGSSLNSPTKFVICWHLGSGGTMQACRIATAYDIPIVNLADSGWKNLLIDIISPSGFDFWF